jgi:hypothetical protein
VVRASAGEQRAAAQAAAVTTQLAASTGVWAQRVEHVITHMKGIRPDLAINDTADCALRDT